MSEDTVSHTQLIMFIEGSVHRLCPGVEDKTTKKRKRRKDTNRQQPVADYILQACKIFVALHRVCFSPNKFLFFFLISPEIIHVPEEI